MDREGLTALLGFARPGDRINVLTLDRLGRNMRETLNLVHDLTERGVFPRTLGDVLAVETREPGPGRTWPSRRWNGSTCWSARPVPARPESHGHRVRPAGGAGRPARPARLAAVCHLSGLGHRRRRPPPARRSRRSGRLMPGARRAGRRPSRAARGIP
ncbi:recombinase family protein [Streptomyces sp. NPDC102274]|uniref:recombinase family protein n=1 Tax=Streptomyces sp. NPDC102274 TaxID=3366151 RepID=UPI0037F3892D